MPRDKRARLKQWLESGEAKLYPATLTQRELWETSPVPPEHVANHICTVTTIRGPVSRDLCVQAMALVVAKQEVLRLSVLPGKNGPVQLVRKNREPALLFHTLTPAQVPDEALDDFIMSLVRQPLDLVAGPLYRLHVLRRSPEDHLLVLVIHHAIADGWTLGVFMTDLWTAYAQLILGVPGSLEPVPQTYTGWGAAQRAVWTPAAIANHAEFWVQHLGHSTRLWSPPPTPEPDPARRGRHAAEFDTRLTTALRAVATTTGATLFSTTLTAFQIVLAAATGKTDTLVGSPVAGRNKNTSRETMGSYAGIVPIRTRIDTARIFAAQLAATHTTTLDCFAHALPFVELVKLLDEPVTPGRNPVFDTRFALQNHPMPDVSMPGLDVTYRTRSTGTARFDLACELTEIGDSMEVIWLFRTDIFSPLDVETLHHHFIATLEAVATDPESPITTLIDLRP